MENAKEIVECEYIEFCAGAEFTRKYTLDDYDSIFLLINDQEYIIDLRLDDHEFLTRLPIRNIIYINYESKHLYMNLK